MNFYKNFSGFQKIFFLFFTIASLIVFLLPLAMGNEFSSIFSILGITGIFCTISGIFVSIYTAKANVFGYIWWIINTVTLAIIAIFNSLYGQFIENAFIVLPLVLYGFIAWTSHLYKNNVKTISTKKLTKNQWVLALALTLICFIAYILFLNQLPFIAYKLFGLKISSDPQIVLDSITATLTIMAVVLTGKRFVEQWVFWMVSNTLSLIMFIIQTAHTGISNPSMFVGDLSNTLSILQYLIGSIYGYLMWSKLHNNSKKQTNLELNTIS